MPSIDNKEFSRVLEQRTLQFAVFIIRLSASLPNNPEVNVIKNQMTKSGTSIGANYREANRAKSKADFRNKIKIVESEASETVYWLEVVTEATFVQKESWTQFCKNAMIFWRFSLQLERNFRGEGSVKCRVWS